MDMERYCCCVAAWKTQTRQDWCVAESELALLALSHETDKLSFNVKALVWSDINYMGTRGLGLRFWFYKEGSRGLASKCTFSRKSGESTWRPLSMGPLWWSGVHPGMEEVLRDPGQKGNQVNKGCWWLRQHHIQTYVFLRVVYTQKLGYFAGVSYTLPTWFWGCSLDIGALEGKCACHFSSRLPYVW